MALTENKNVPDPGQARYGGTLRLAPSGNACGVFRYEFELSSPTGVPYTYLQVQTYYYIVPSVQPLVVSVCIDDGVFCNGAESCDPVLGCVITPVDCNDGVACTVDSCNEATRSCDHTPSNSLCDDGDSCTVDACAPTGCTHTYQCGSCCNHNNGSCNDSVLAADCSCGDCEWTPAGSCATNQCTLVLTPIPTTTHWGHVILTLALLCIAKIYSTRADSNRTSNST